MKTIKIKIAIGLFSQYYMTVGSTAVLSYKSKPTVKELKTLATSILNNAFIEDDNDPELNGFNKQHGVVDITVHEVKTKGKQASYLELCTKSNTISSVRELMSKSDSTGVLVDDVPVSFKPIIIYPFDKPKAYRFASRVDNRYPLGRSLPNPSTDKDGVYGENCGAAGCSHTEDVTYYYRTKSKFLCFHCAAGIGQYNSSIVEFNNYQFSGQTKLLKDSGLNDIESSDAESKSDKYDVGIDLA